MRFVLSIFVIVMSVTCITKSLCVASTLACVPGRRSHHGQCQRRRGAAPPAHTHRHAAGGAVHEEDAAAGTERVPVLEHSTCSKD